MSTSNSISVVVPTRNRPELLDGCLRAIRESLREGDELIVADSASTDPHVRVVAGKHDATYVRCHERGASRARNLGWRTSAHAIIAFIDDDVRVDTTWASAVAHAFTDETTMFVTGRIEEAAESHVPPLAQKTQTVATVLDPDNENVLGHSANLIVRRVALEKIGGFDEVLGAGGRFRAAEDLDLFDRLFQAGLIGRYEPSVAAAHVPWRRLRDYIRVQGSYGIGMGARIAKLLRIDSGYAARQMRWAVIEVGLVPLRDAIRARWLVGIIARSLRLGGTVIGFVLGALHPVRDGHFGRGAQRDRRPSLSSPR